jgi:hypothetical protein
MLLLAGGHANIKYDWIKAAIIKHHIIFCVHFQGLYDILDVTISLLWQHPERHPVFPCSSSTLNKLYLYSSLLRREILVISLDRLPLKS